MACREVMFGNACTTKTGALGQPTQNHRNEVVLFCFLVLAFCFCFFLFFFNFAKLVPPLLLPSWRWRGRLRLGACAAPPPPFPDATDPRAKVTRC